ncbi:hypothetical protein [Chromohalobacter sp. 296-RDG]|uniref:hypothetical protein n=1 Tax=Chromohalobacter sp. 296-RDG TaxID=2994062 RepID=UPI002468DCF1|nr:hypothetical protein [Chromohalobacter sp. 296-RDG]
MKLEEVKPDDQIRGIKPDTVVRIVAVVPVGTDALTVYYKDSQGAIHEQMLFRGSEPNLALAEGGPSGGLSSPMGSGGAAYPATPSVAKKHFYGTVDLNSVKAKMGFATLVDEIVEQFTQRTGVEVKVAVEIEASIASMKPCSVP